MTARERRELIEKKENGTLTEAEHEQYLNLLRTDDDFYEEVSLYQLMNDAARQEADSQLWSSFEAALSETPPVNKKPDPVKWVYQHPAFAMAASITIFLFVVWVISRFLTDDEPRIVKVETNYLFRADGGTKTDVGKGYAGGDMPVGSLPVKWIENKQLPTMVAYQYCQDTLTVFIQNESDTLYLQNARLRYNTSLRSLSVQRPNRSVTSFKECTSTPQPF